MVPIEPSSRFSSRKCVRRRETRIFTRLTRPDRTQFYYDCEGYLSAALVVFQFTLAVVLLSAAGLIRRQRRQRRSNLLSEAATDIIPSQDPAGQGGARGDSPGQG